MLIGVGWVGAWGGACYRSLLLEHNAHWGVGHVAGHVTVLFYLNTMLLVWLALILKKLSVVHERN